MAMADAATKDLIEKKISRFKEKIRIKNLQMDALLNITQSINNEDSTFSVLEKYKHFVKEQLSIEKLILYSKGKKWRCLLQYGVTDQEIDLLDVERDLIHLKEITSVAYIATNALATFDMVVPVYLGEKPLAYLLLGDQDNEAISISSIIKHLNFLQLLTNILVSAIENRQVARDKLKEEREKKRLIEMQNVILEQQVAERTKELRSEKDKSEELLHNILPVEIAIELKKKGYTLPQKFDAVSILFTDLKEFTATSATISPTKLVGELNDIFKAFDHIMDKYDVEKIKTIGDAYMAVCGIPKPMNLHAVQAVNAAMEMIEFLNNRSKTAGIKWQMRVGIHSGPLVAGVVGTKKFTYDVWGDAVNTASRMESNGEPGRINISASTYELVKDFFECDYRGKITAKGKGEIEMYFVNGEKGSAQFKMLKAKLVEKLKKELPKNLYYHGLHHTFDVYNSAVFYAIDERVDEKNIELLKIAALFHDSGYIGVYKGHEEAGCKLVRELVPGYGYSPEDIDIICGIIMATKIPQVAETPLQKIICDADLDYLGRDDFKSICDTLFKELNEHGMVTDVENWNRMQVDFLEKHHFFTDTAVELREPVKQRHLAKLKDIIATYGSI